MTRPDLRPVEEPDPLAVGSLVCAVLSPLFLFTVFPAIVLGHISRSRSRRMGRRPSGLATAGLVIGYVWLACLVAGAVALVLLVRSLGTAG